MTERGVNQESNRDIGRTTSPAVCRLQTAVTLTSEERIHALEQVVAKLFRLLTTDQRRSVIRGRFSLEEKVVLTQSILTATERNRLKDERIGRASPAVTGTGTVLDMQTAQASEQTPPRSEGSIYERVTRFVKDSNKPVTAESVVEHFVGAFREKGLSTNDLTSQVGNMLDLLASRKELMKNPDGSFSKT